MGLLGARGLPGWLDERQAGQLCCVERWLQGRAGVGRVQQALRPQLTTPAAVCRPLRRPAAGPALIAPHCGTDITVLFDQSHAGKPLPPQTLQQYYKGPLSPPVAG